MASKRETLHQMKVFLPFIFALGFQITTGKYNVVQTCPETKATWDHRSSMFTCVDKNKKYHCVMDSTWKLVEICISPLNISRKEGGCPSIHIVESELLWLYPLTRCSTENINCPRKGQGSYSSEELFKYPACFLNESEREWGRTEFQQTTITARNSASNEHNEECYRSVDVISLIISMTTLVLIAALFIFNILQGRQTRYHIAKVLKQEMSKGTSQISIPSWDSPTELSRNEKWLNLYSVGSETRSSISFEDGGSVNGIRSNELSRNEKWLNLYSVGSETRSSVSFEDGGSVNGIRSNGTKNNKNFSLSSHESSEESRLTLKPRAGSQYLKTIVSKPKSRKRKQRKTVQNSFKQNTDKPESVIAGK